MPEAVQGVQAWDRYAYVNNNPVRHQDPTGHSVPVPENPWDDLYIPVSDGWDLVAAAACFVACDFLPVHYESYGPGQGAIVGDTLAQSADKAMAGLAGAIASVHTKGGLEQAVNQAEDIADGTMTYRAITDGYPFNWKPTKGDIGGIPPGLSCSVGCEDMTYHEIFEMSVGRPAGPGDRLFQAETNVLQNSQFGLISDPIPGQNPYHAVTGGKLVDKWKNAIKNEFKSLWEEIWYFEQ